MSKKTSIVLTGFMGSGKSAVGRILSDKLGRVFYDLDEVVEHSEQASIKEVFAQKGEKAFRIREKEHLAVLLKKNNGVIALGGGTLHNDNIVTLVKQNGILVYLDVPFETLFKRLKKNYHDRPMLHDQNGMLPDDLSLRNRIRELFDQRSDRYAKADLAVRVQPDWSKEKTAQHVLMKLSQYAIHPLPDNP